MEDRSSQTPSDDLVPLDILRPSREHFGPVSKSGKAAKDSPKAAQKKQGQSRSDGARSRSGQPGPRALPSGSQPAGGSQPALKRGPAPVQGRPALPRAVETPKNERPAQARPSAPRSKGHSNAQPASPRSTTRQGRATRRPSAHNGEFANRLAADDRAPNATVPQSGWRGVVAKASGGAIKLPLSAGEQAELNYRKQVRRPVTAGTMAVFSRKGGVGKTTIAAYLGLTLAAERGGRIVAVDGDAEAGSLGWLLAPDAPSTLAALASAEPMPADYASLRSYATRTASGLDVIVGDPAEMGPVSTTGLEVVAGQLARHYDLSIFDTGAGVTRATGRVLVNSARTLLLVMGPSIDSVRAAERTLAWLDERPGAVHPDARIVAVINGIPSSTKKSHVDRIASHFSDRAAAVVRIPWDAHLAAGSTTVSLDQLAKPTRRAFLELAAVTVGTLAVPVRRPGNRGARRAS